MIRSSEVNAAGGLKILGTGRALPSACMTSAQLDKRFGFEAGRIEYLTGVAQRYWITEETQVDLAVEASHRAVTQAGLTPQDLDVIISACAVPYQPIPSMAPLIQHGLGIADGTCFGTDVNATCLSFPMALQMADGMLARDPALKILIVSAEVASRGLPWPERPEVAGLFGDGAGAVVAGYAQGAGVRSAHFATYPSAYDACSLGAGGTRFDFETDATAFAENARFSMDGKALFKLTAKHFAGFVDDLLAQAGCGPLSIDHVIPHQASPAGLAHLTKICSFDAVQVMNVAVRYGNQIAASIPFVLDLAREQGTVTDGQTIAILGTSAGVSFGGLVLKV